MGPVEERFPGSSPTCRPYRKLVVCLLLLTVARRRSSALAEPWPLALMIDSVLGDQPAARARCSRCSATNPDPYRLLVFIVGLGFLIVDRSATACA